MPDRDRRQAAAALSTLERLIEQIDSLGRDAEDAAARVTSALGGKLLAWQNADQRQLLTAIGDVIEIVTRRSQLAHEAHRLISDLRRRESDRWRQSGAAKP
jgi:hypothetical protein